MYLSCRSSHVTDSAVVDDIVLPAMAKNRRLDITGCLWFDRDRFLQTLEGPDESVDAVYSQIEKDRRHEQVTLLLREPQANRLFPRWAMKPVPAMRADVIRELVADFGALPQRCVPEQATAETAGPGGGGAVQTIHRLLRMLAARTG